MSVRTTLTSNSYHPKYVRLARIIHKNLVLVHVAFTKKDTQAQKAEQ